MTIELTPAELFEISVQLEIRADELGNDERVPQIREIIKKVDAELKRLEQ